METTFVGIPFQYKGIPCQLRYNAGSVEWLACAFKDTARTMVWLAVSATTKETSKAKLIAAIDKELS